MKTILACLSLALVTAKADDNDYCSVKCEVSGYVYEHTVCQYEQEGGAACTSQDYRRGLFDEERDLIVRRHNELRQKVASGDEPGQPSATDMQDLSWDYELEYIAQRLTDQCKENEHDKCRDSLDGTSVGQNIAWGNSFGYDIERMDIINDAIQDWYDEVQLFDQSGVDSYEFDHIYGHYTQMVWAKTNSVGCGFLDKLEPDNNNNYEYKLVCNYKPSGNYIGEPVYTRG